jgi:hypothetical protein
MDGIVEMVLQLPKIMHFAAFGTAVSSMVLLLMVLCSSSVLVNKIYRAFLVVFRVRNSWNCYFFPVQ